MTVPTSCPLGTRLVHLINIADSFQRFRYFKKNHQKVLNDISLSIGSGETVGIIGSTGSGKSTLISLISRLYDADEGRVLVDTHASGDVMSRFTNDVDAVGEMLNTTLIQIISGAVTIIGTVILMLYTSLILGAITLIMTPFLTWISKKIVERGRSAYRIQQKTLGMLNGFSEETISGQKVIKIFNHEENAQEEFSYLNNELCEAQINAQFLSSTMGPITHQLCNVSYALTACIGGILVVARGFDIGGLTVSLNYTRQFNRPINEISMQMNTVFSAWPVQSASLMCWKKNRKLPIPIWFHFPRSVDTSFWTM